MRTCLKDLTAKESIDDGMMSDAHTGTNLEPTTWVDVFEPVAVYLHTILSRFRNAQVEVDFQVLVRDVHGMIHQWRERLGDSHTPNMRRMLESIELSLQLVQREEERSRRELVRREAAMRAEVLEGSIVEVAVPMTAYHQGEQIDGPGDLSIAGQPRHDNDFVDIAEIRIAPTTEEVLCDLQPYLPYNGRNAQHHLPQDSTARHLDTHFRLLREDFMNSIRESCRAWMHASAVAKASIRDRFFYSSNNFVFSYKNVKLSSILIDQRQGVTLMIEFDDIKQLEKKTLKDRKEFWQKSKRLNHGSLICISWQTGGQTGLAFTTVVIRNADELANGQVNRPMIGLATLSDEGTTDLLRVLLNPLACRNVVMLQTCDSYFSYRPILQGIQNIAQDVLPLLQYIINPNHGRVGMPGYIQENTVYDLSSLLDPEKMQGVQSAAVENVLIKDEEALAAATAFLRQHSFDLHQ